MSNTCPECGAFLPDGNSCQEIFDSFLVLEFTHPAYGEIHMLTVACFLIQHGRYSDEGLTWIAEKLRSNLEDGVSADQIRRQATKEMDQKKRTWKVNRSSEPPLLPKVAWSMTIADVAAKYKDAESYCKLITQWAKITLQEMKPLLDSKKEKS